VSEVYVVGLGGHANSIIEIIKRDTKLKYTQLDYNDLLTSSKGLEIGRNIPYILAVGDVEVRKRLSNTPYCSDIIAMSVISREAYVGSDAEVAKGVVIMPNAVVRTMAKIGVNSIINTGAIVEHESTIGAFVNISPGAIVCGGVSVGDSCVLGAGAIIRDKVSICSGVTIGAGAVVVSDINEPGTYIGVPAKRV
jgi:sugar O-acyltransferase (sialic acid O-acetyltransferase NeuD family)